MGLNQDLDNIKAIEDKLTANKVAKFAYTDHAYDNPLTEADGVTYYNVDNEQNIPVADPSVMNVNETVLTKGWRSQASSITRMLMNHFLGRVSYNLNKLNDNMSALLTTLRTNLSNVVNTGDSANASSGGTTKFTTGGAYNLLSSIAPYFSTSTTYAVGALITYQNKLYECTTAHSAGAWNANHFTARSVQYVISNYILPSFAPAFSTSTSYAVGAFVIYQNKLYRCKTTHSAGEWNTSHFELATLNDINTSLGTKADLLDLAPAFSTSTSYAVGDYVTYNGNLYRCTVAHSAGAWNNSDFTLVTVGSELALKADKASLALPTDAVLHYSFDEVPDYPDGTADYRFINDNTYSIFSSPSSGVVRNMSNSTFSNYNGKLQVALAERTDGQSGFYFYVDYTRNKTIKIQFEIKNLSNNGKVYIENGKTNRIAEYNRNGVYEITFIGISAGVYPSVFFIVEQNVSCNITFNKIYIGDGSYSTPIIDNANGQNNATNNGGIAVQGVSGKGVYFLNGKYATINNTDWDINHDWSFSLWINPKDNDNTETGSIINKESVINFTNGDAQYAPNSLHLFLYRDGASNLNYNLGTLLPSNGWTLITLQRNGDDIIYYKNGEKKKNYTLPTSILRTSNSNMLLCRGTNTRPQSVDDFFIFNRALTETEVLALYLNKANTPKYYDINNYNLKQIKNITVQSTDFADFQSRMAGLSTRRLQLIEPTEDER